MCIYQQETAIYWIKPHETKIDLLHCFITFIFWCIYCKCWFNIRARFSDHRHTPSRQPSVCQCILARNNMQTLTGQLPTLIGSTLFSLARIVDWIKSRRRQQSFCTYCTKLFITLNLSELTTKWFCHFRYLSKRIISFRNTINIYTLPF